MKVLFLCAHTPTYIWHRWELLETISKMGHEVIAVGPGKFEEWKEKFEGIGVRYMQVAVSRTGMNPVVDYRSYRAIMTLLINEAPDKVFVYMSKTVVLGSLAAAKVGIEDVYALIGGLGSIIRGTGLKNYIFKMGLKSLYTKAFQNCKTVFFHNDDDARVLVDGNVLPKDKVTVVNGSGVNLTKFTPQPFPTLLTFLFAGRLIKDKGIREYLIACKAIKKENPEVRCLVVGRFDSKPTVIKRKIIRRYIDEGIIEYFDENDDIRPFITMSSVVILPSYHEGRPKILLEAMAMGRPVITTDVPGCRETLENGKNGYLVNANDSEDLASKMKNFIENPGIEIKMGEESIHEAQNQYDVKIINHEILKTLDIKNLKPHAPHPKPILNP